MTTDLLTGEHQAGGGVIPFWRAVYEIARKEVIVFTRTKRLYITGGIFAFGLLVTTLFWAYLFTSIFGGVEGFFGGAVPIGLSRANVVMSLALGAPIIGAYTFLNVLGIIFTFDGIVREYEDKTLFLLLSKPVSREAFVLGKYLGAVFSVGALFFVLSTIMYFIVMMVVGEFASPGDFLRFYLGLSMILLGMLALAAMALFWSAIVRSVFASVVLSFLSLIVVLPLLANAGLIYAGFSQDLSAENPIVQGMRYMNPGNSIGPAVLMIMNLVGEVGAAGVAVPFGGLDLDPMLMQVALLGFTAAFLAGAVIAVNRRNFE